MKLKFFGICTVLAVCILGNGCKEDEAPQLSLMQSKLIIELFNALSNGDTKESLACLDRLEGATGETEFSRIIRTHEKERQTVTLLNDSLLNDNIAQTEALVDKEDLKDNLVHRYGELSGLFEALKSIEAFELEKPYANSVELEIAVAEVQRTCNDFKNVPAVGKWLESNNKQLKEMKIKENELRMDKYIGIIDQAVAYENREYERSANRFCEMFPASAFAKYYKSGKNNKFNFINDAINIDFEIAALIFYDKMPVKTKEALKRRYAGVKSGSASGNILKLIFAVEANDYNKVKEFLKSSEKVKLGKKRVAYLLAKGVMRPEQFNAGCWRSPVPSITDFLNYTTQLRD